MPSNPSLWQVIKSVAASAIGVQSSKNYEQDFATSNPLPFIIVGVIFVICFIVYNNFVINDILSYSNIIKKSLYYFLDED